MPSLRPVEGVIRVSFRGTATGQAIVNVFHFQRDGGMPTAATMQTFLQNVRSPYELQFIPQVAGSYSGDSVYGVDLSSDEGTDASVPLGGNPGPTSSTTPQSTACCITWKIGRHYRGGHPRTYIGPVPSTAIESPTSFTSTYAGQMQVRANAFLTAVNAVVLGGAPVRLVAVHRQRDKLQLATPLVSPITSAVVDTRIDTMRRRLGRDR